MPNVDSTVRARSCVVVFTVGIAGASICVYVDITYPVLVLQSSFDASCTQCCCFSANSAAWRMIKCKPTNLELFSMARSPIAISVLDVGRILRSEGVGIKVLCLLPL